MRTHRRISAVAAAAVFALAACGGDGGGSAEIGSNDGLEATTGEERPGGLGEGREASGSPSAQVQTTSVNDTTPHRPGAPGAPAEPAGEGNPGSRAETGNTGN